MPPIVTEPGPLVTAAAVEFRLRDPGGRYRGVRLLQELVRPRNRPQLVRAGGDWWSVGFPRPAVDRMEYQFEVLHADGRIETICDPGNPRRAPGAFGDKSVVEFPGYGPPAWLDGGQPAPRPANEPGGTMRFELASPRLRADVATLLWSAPGTDPEEPLPLLIAHDGPEYARYSGLVHFLERMHAQGRVPPMRAALLAPVDRNESYSASARYAQALWADVLPALGFLAPTPAGRRWRVGMGASLGALAMLHLHRIYPGALGGLYLQSGSYFRQRYDKQESGFPRFRRIARFVGETLNASDWPDPVRVTLTCGTVEENLANNRAVRSALERQGYDVELHTHRDAHNYTSWRDTFDPHLVELLGDVGGDGSPQPR